MQALRKQLMDCRRQNAKLRAYAIHDCALCRMCRCAVRERLFKTAFARQMLTLRAES
jgi:hypothetical protein